jgi:predicted nucleotidyltransferase
MPILLARRGQDIPGEKQRGSQNMPKESSSSVRVYYPRFDRQQLIQRLKEDLEALKEKLPLLLVVLFGSYAKGNYTVASDVDLLVIYEGKDRKDAFAIVKKTISIPHLEPHVYSESEYEEVKEIIRKMTRDGITLFKRRETIGEI